MKKEWLIVPVMIMCSAITLSASEEIENVQNAISKSGAKWQAAENWVTKLSVSERRKLLGYVSDPTRYVNAKMIELPVVKSIPAQFDWRDNNGNWVTPVRNQGDCGSCWDFSAVAQIEAWWKIYNSSSDYPDLSEQFVLSCGDNGGCDGDGIETALDFAISTGIPPESYLTYQQSDAISCSNAGSGWQSNVTTIPGWGYVTMDEEIVSNIKSAVYYHPVSASFDVYTDFYSYSSGIYEYTTGEYEGGHAILIVGWDDSEECWICKNSWGTSWGEDGYFRIKWGECGIGTYTPFIYDEMLTTPSLSFSPMSVDLSLVAGDSAEVVFTVKNTGSGTLECSLIDYLSINMFHIDDFESYDGSSWWCGSEDIGGYEDHWLQYLETPLIDLSATSGPKLTWKGRWEVEDPSEVPSPYDGWDGCNVWLSTDGGQTFNVITPTAPVYNCDNLYSFSDPDEGWDLGDSVPGWGGSSDGWVDVEFDLSGYREDSVIIRWALASDQAYSTSSDASLIGYFVDNIQVLDGSAVIFSNDGSSAGEMTILGFGSSVADWINVNSDGLTIASGDSIDVGVKITSEDLDSGEYPIIIYFVSNDETVSQNYAIINLNVTSPEHDLAITENVISNDTIPALMPFTGSVIIYNRGLNEETKFKVIGELTNSDEVLFIDTVSVGSLSSDSSISIQFSPFTVSDTGIYYFNTRLADYSVDNCLNNNTYSSKITITNLVDDFEDESGYWDYQGGWGTTSRISRYSGKRASHVNDGSSPYENNMDATMTFLPGFELANNQYVVLSFWDYYNIEQDKDYCYFEVSRDSTTWTTVLTYTGTQTTWTQQTVALNEYITSDSTQLWFRFHFVSDASGTSTGFLVDEIEINSGSIAATQTAAQTNPSEYKLAQNYPNPFNPVTKFNYQLPEETTVDLSVFNFRGQLVEKVVSGRQPAGFYTIDWNAEHLPSGIYFYRLTAGQYSQTKKCVLLK